MKRRVWQLLVLLLVFEIAAGCSTEPRGVTVHEPGVYKGGKDPLTAVDQQQVLNDRFRLVQTDR